MIPYPALSADVESSAWKRYSTADRFSILPKIALISAKTIGSAAQKKKYGAAGGENAHFATVERRRTVSFFVFHKKAWHLFHELP